MPQDISTLLNWRSQLETELENAQQLPDQYSLSGSHAQTPRKPRDIQKDLHRVNMKIKRLSRGKTRESYTNFE